ncbi:hydrolase 1, exosortase A system-associated [Paucibacter sp. APW11]|uniref:Hydrolase 1, exosortase A system-associated n=1 Tax=Roseateles aquae TaxID=3077235 RepID=A0ABU3P5S4_9BURK|nr:hydrolase 1, exosortase A system-associated [Paucibacter sp. APW11]MDT8997926.1 hydrolase 1, exosortase A system-associated [Paucibacter sp. APW11]
MNSSPLAYQERALAFDCEGQALLGIVSEPKAGSARATLGVLIIVGGPQYRAGSHRQFVLQARHWASAGYPVLRFDYRGMGDSAGMQRDFERVSSDIGAAISAFMSACPDLEGVVLWGLCDAASAALLYVHEHREDRRVKALALANPWVRTAQGLARAQAKHYYLQRLKQPEFWLKLIKGGVGLQALRSLGSNLAALLGRPAAAADAGAPASERALGFQDRMALGLRHFKGRSLLLLSGEDLTAQEFLDHSAGSPAWNGLLTASTLKRVDFKDADHTFSGPGSLQAMNSVCLDWLLSLGRPGAAVSDPPSLAKATR